MAHMHWDGVELPEPWTLKTVRLTSVEGGVEHESRCNRPKRGRGNQPTTAAMKPCGLTSFQVWQLAAMIYGMILLTSLQSNDVLTSHFPFVLSCFAISRIHFSSPQRMGGIHISRRRVPCGLIPNTLDPIGLHQPRISNTVNVYSSLLGRRLW